MPRIQKITARQILDSRGVPTVEATIELDSGVSASSSVPSGSIANKEEAYELRDQNGQEFFGLGVSKAVNNINTAINDALVGMDPLFQTQIDQALVNLDGTTNKSKLGGNAILAVSQAVMKAAAASLRLPLFVYVKEKYQMVNNYRIPTPIFNLINGGNHGSGTLDFQEFQLVPASHLSYSQSLRIGVELFMALERTLEQKGAIRAVGVEGGFSPNLASNTDALEIFAEAIKLTPYALAKDAFLGLDVVPKHFMKNGKFILKDKSQPLTSKQLIQLYKDLHSQFRVFSFEDPLPADAWGDWKFMTTEMGGTAMVVADDLIATNKTLLMKAIQEKACNAVVIKPNRIGTVTETVEIIHIANEAGWHTVMSHRSGETTDDFLADLAVGVGTEYVKFGAPSRGERVVKYNRLLRIEEILLRSNQSTNTGEPTMNMSSNAPNPLGTDPNAQNTATAPDSSNPADPTTNPNTPPMGGAPVTAEPAAAPAPTQPSVAPAPTPTPTPTAVNPSAVDPNAPQIATPPAPQPTTPEASLPTVPVPPTNADITPAAQANELASATPAPDPAPQPAVAPPNPSVSQGSNVAAAGPDTTPSPAPIVPPAATPNAPTPAAVAAPSTAPDTSGAPEVEVNDLQNSLNELASMAGTEPMPSPAATPTAAPAQSAAPTPQPGPGGLTPPTPPANATTPTNDQ